MGALLTGCSAFRELTPGSSHDDADRSDHTCLPPGMAPDPSPSPAPTLDPHVAEEVRSAVAAVRALPAVADVTEETSNTRGTTPDPDRSNCLQVENHFASTVAVTMSPDATPAEAGSVPSTMAEHLAWTEVSLALTVPAATGHVTTVVHYDRTFDQTITHAEGTEIAAGLARLAGTPHVTAVEASIPYTMRVDYGTLTVAVGPSDQATLASVRDVIGTTVFRDTTLHGSFHNGAKP
jgi:hypothetical protein